MTAITVLGTTIVAANILRALKEAKDQVHESLGEAAEFGASFAQAIAPEDTGAYKYGGVSRRGTFVSNGITWKFIEEFQSAYGTPAPYGRRLELGYTGPDRLGRTFNDPPRPHFGPSMDPTGEYLMKDLMGKGFRR